MRHRIKFYTPNDLSSGSNLLETERLLNNGIIINSVNDAIELYNIKLYFDSNIKLEKWTKDDFSKYVLLVKAHTEDVYKFFRNITDDTIISMIEELESSYCQNFWDLFEYKECYQNISDEVFGKVLQIDKVRLGNILKQKKTVNKYKELLRNSLLAWNQAAEILLSLNSRQTAKQQLYLPNNLTSEDKEKIIECYIASPNPTQYFLALIVQLPPSSKLHISDRMRLNAKKRKIEIEETVFKDGVVSNSTIRIIFEEQDVAANMNFSGDTIQLTYDSRWLKGNLDYPTILNNFIYLFEFVDNQMLFTNMSKKNELGIFEQAYLPNDPTFYQTGSTFYSKFDRMRLQLFGYGEILKENNIYLEEVIEWFFKEYLAEEFAVSKFKIQMPSKDTSYLEKCTLMMPIIDLILKQFELLVQEGEIDFELLSIQSNSKKVYDISSFVEKKYAYGQGEDFAGAVHLLFSDQSPLLWLRKNQKEYRNFVQVIIGEQIIVNNVESYQIPRIQWLIEQGLLKIDKKHIVSLTDEKVIHILKNLYDNGVTCKNYYPKDYQNSLLLLEKKGYIKFGKSLLSKPEAEYYNFLLNKVDFRNSYDIRNKYAHGNQQLVESNDEHMKNYHIMLHVAILLIIKINDDLCQRDATLE